MRVGAVGFLVGLVVFAGAVPARADKGLSVEADSVYRVGDETVAVEVIFTLRNEVPDKTEDGIVYQYFYDRLPVALPSSAAGVVAVSGGSRLAVTTEEDGSGILATVHLPDRLLYGQERTVRVTFDLVGGDPRSDEFQRVNDAYAWFVAWAYGDPGRSSVRVIIPPGSEVEWLGGPVTQIETDEGQILVAEAVADPEQWYVAVSVRDDAALESEVVRFRGGDLTIRSWPGDEVWTGFVSDVITRGVPVLIENIGLTWPDEDLEVLQSYSPYIYGYAGWYLPDQGRIEVGEDLDAQTVLHELAHLWVNNGLFDARWINEGLAEELALQTRLEVGLEGPSPPVSPPQAGKQLLNRWDIPRFDRGDNQEREAYGYTTSWLVTHRLVSEIGVEAMSEVIASADADLIAYRGDDEPETVAVVDDWRRYLDLLEEVGGSTEAEALFRRYAVTRLEAETLDVRAESRAAYHRLQELGDRWAMPPAVRIPMGEWRFDDAAVQITTGQVALQTRDEIAEAAVRLGVRPPDLERMFEQSTDLAPVIEALNDQKDSVYLLVEAQSEIERPKTFMETIGLLGSDPEDGFEQARLAFEDNDLAQSDRLGRDVLTEIGSASDSGAGRVSLGVGSATMVGLGTWMLRRNRGGGRARPAAAFDGHSLPGAETNGGSQLVPSSGGETGQASSDTHTDSSPSD